MIARLLGLAAVAAGLSGCVSAKIEQLREASTAVTISAGESAVILSRRHHGDHETEETFTGCVARSMQRSKIPIYPEQRFVDAMFPWLEPRTAPQSAEGLNTMLDNPAVAARVKATKVRFMIWIDGETETVDRKGAMSCGLTPTGGGCLGLTWWDSRAKYTAAIWDMRERQVIGKAQVEATGTSIMPAVIIPIPLIAPIESTACAGVASQLSDLLLPIARKKPGVRGSEAGAAKASAQRGAPTPGKSTGRRPGYD